MRASRALGTPHFIPGLLRGILASRQPLAFLHREAACFLKGGSLAAVAQLVERQPVH